MRQNVEEIYSKQANARNPQGKSSNSAQRQSPSKPNVTVEKKKIAEARAYNDQELKRDAMID